MTKEKNKHDHKLTNLLKVGIFTLLMIAPLFASVSQWAYATINKNAYQSYTQQANAEETYNNATSIVLGNDYRFIPTDYTTETNIEIYFTNKGTYADIYLLPQIQNCDQIILRPNKTIVFYSNGTYIAEENYNSKTFMIDMTLNAYNPNNTETINALKSLLNIKHIEDNAYLDNAFYYGVEQMTNSDLFNWTENTTIYTGIKGMTDNLEIQTNAIAILLTYWTILTIVYVIFDILIQGFTFITHKIVE